MITFWLLVAALATLVAEIVIFQIFAMHKVRYDRTFSRTSATAGEQVELVEVLRNNKLLPIPWLRVETRISPYLRFRSQENLDINQDQYHKSVFHMPAFKQITRRHQITCTHRGVFDLDSAMLVTGDLFGLSQQNRQLNLNARLYVYPKLLSDEDADSLSQKWQGDVVMPRWILPDPYLVNGIREYTRGDPMRDIHWKATARTGRLQVKTHDFTAQPKLLIYLNVQPTENLWGELTPKEKEQMEYAVSYAATLIAKALAQGMEVGLFSNGMLAGSDNLPVRVMPASGEEQYEKLMETLACLNLRRSLSLHAMMHADADAGLEGADILVLSPYWSELTEAEAQYLRGKGNGVSYLVLPVGEEAALYA